LERTEKLAAAAGTRGKRERESWAYKVGGAAEGPTRQLRRQVCGERESGRVGPARLAEPLMTSSRRRAQHVRQARAWACDASSSPESRRGEEWPRSSRQPASCSHDQARSQVAARLGPAATAGPQQERSSNASSIPGERVGGRADEVNMCGHLAFLHCFACTAAGRRAHDMGCSDAAFASAYNTLDEMTER
jgi:hypothetical protein